MSREARSAFSVSGAVSELPSRQTVSLISWFGLLFGVLHVLGGRRLGFVEILASLAGLYGTWSNVHNRGRYVAFFTSCWGVQCVLETLYFLLLLTSLSVRTTGIVLDLVTSSTFKNLSGPLGSFFEALRSDFDGFVAFSAFTSCIFATLALYYGISLCREITATTALPELAPLVSRTPARRPNPGVQNFGSLGQTSQDERPPLPKPKAFQGKGNRLGAE